jgi:hypothetical protein
MMQLVTRPDLQKMSNIFSTPQAKALISSKLALIPRLITLCVVDDVVVSLRTYSSDEVHDLTLETIRQDAVVAARDRYPRSGAASRFQKSEYHVVYGEVR